MRADVAALSLLAAAEQAHTFWEFVPDYYTVSNWDKPSPEQLDRLRRAYLPALIFGVSIGAVVSFLVKSPLPLFLTVATGLGMVVLYEQALPPDVRLSIRNLAEPNEGGLPCGRCISVSDSVGF